MATPATSAFFDTSRIASIMRYGSGNGVHMVLIGDSKTYGDNTKRFPSGFFREFGVADETIPWRGIVGNASSGVTDSHSRGWAGTSGQTSILLDSKPGQDLTASGGAGTFTLWETVTQAGSGASGKFLSESGGIVKVWNQGESTPFNGSGGITGGSSGATRNVTGVANATVDHKGFAAGVLFKPRMYQQGTGSISVSTAIFRSDMENQTLFGGGDWTTARTLYARLISYGGTFTALKVRTYRNTTSIESSGTLSLSAEGFAGYETNSSAGPLSLGNGAGVPCKARWEAFSTADRTGQYGYFVGALIYDPTNAGLSMDYMAVGGAGIEDFVDTAYMSDANFAAYMALTVPPTAGYVVYVIDFGQNNAAMNQATFETNLAAAITRCIDATPAGVVPKFIICAPYNATGGAHFTGKRDGAYNVAEARKTYCAFDNRYDRYTADEIADPSRTDDGIHPTLAFSQQLAQDIVDEIRFPTVLTPRSMSYHGRFTIASRRQAWLGARP